jgi:class 3 adenylate cyclase
VLTCTRCGQENPDGAKFCNACGAPLAGDAVLAEERRVVSVLFVDLVGFTSTSEQLDPEDVRAILTPYYERVRGELERLGGTVEKFVGDAVMGVFGAPTAYGDDAERAVRAALAVRDWAAGEGLQVRVAVNTGEAIVALEAAPGSGEAMVAGDVVNTAARLQSAAPVGGVIVGRETYASTRTAIEYRPASPVVAKGKSEPVAAWLALEALSGEGERVLTRAPMVGRDYELSVLTDTWARVAEERRPQFVTVFGPAGIGKSRLALEFAQHVTAGGGRALRGRSTPYGASTPYSAFGHHVKQIAGVFDSDEMDDARAKLRETLVDLVGSEGEGDAHAGHLAMLLGLGEDGEARDRETLFFSARVLVESLAGREPVLLLFEDIHWADDSLLDLIETLASRVRDAPVLLLALARPELLTSRPGWGGGLPAYTSLPLERLSEEAASELAARLLERSAGARERAESVARTAEGNPLFIEELAASVAEQRSDAGEQLPTSIRAIVAARLDALPPAERALLLDAAVVGRVFWRGALARMHEHANLALVLDSLEQRDFVRREAVSRIQGDQQFAFKHGLIRDVAYQRLPRAERRERHAAVATYLEEATGGAGQANEALAGHWREAGEPQRAVDCLLVAADQAGRGWAKEHAVTLYRTALELVPGEEDELRRDVTRRLAVALQAAYHIPDAERLRPSPEA